MTVPDEVRDALAFRVMQEIDLSWNAAHEVAELLLTHLEQVGVIAKNGQLVRTHATDRQVESGPVYRIRTDQP